jgi:hypothetical protein
LAAIGVGVNPLELVKVDHSKIDGVTN